MMEPIVMLIIALAILIPVGIMVFISVRRTIRASPEVIVLKTMKHSSKSMESITDDEEAFIAKAIKDKTPQCPDCQRGKFLKGPEGGMSMNLMCDHCHSEFSLAIFYNPNSVSANELPTIMGERISEPGPRDPGDRGVYYGIQRVAS